MFVETVWDEYEESSRWIRNASGGFGRGLGSVNFHPLMKVCHLDHGSADLVLAGADAAKWL